MRIAWGGEGGGWGMWDVRWSGLMFERDKRDKRGRIRGEGRRGGDRIRGGSWVLGCCY